MTSYIEVADITATIDDIGTLLTSVKEIIPEIIAIMLAMAVAVMVVGFFSSISGFLGDALNISKMWKKN